MNRRVIDAFAYGVLFTSWFAELTSQDVALIRLPATVWIGVSLAIDVVQWARTRR
jgi:hypothetical protein